MNTPHVPPAAPAAADPGAAAPAADPVTVPPVPATAAPGPVPSSSAAASGSVPGSSAAAPGPVPGSSAAASGSVPGPAAIAGPAGAAADSAAVASGPAAPVAARSARAAGHAAPARPVSPAAAPRSPVRWIALIAAAAFAIEMAVSARYGYHRDELYFLAAGQHPAFGYVDQPPLTPLLARLSAVLSGNSLIALRLIPALGLAALVALTAAMSRLLGAGRAGQVLAALATATCGEFLGAMHLMTTTTPDFVFWAVLLLLVLKLLTSQNPRWWVAIGACAGIAAEAKWNIAFLLGGLAIGFAATSARRLAASRWLAVGAVLAAALAAPDIIWQAAHGWPAFDVFGALQGDAGHNRAVYWPAQIVYPGLALMPVWITGLVWSLRSPAARPVRSVGIAAAAVLGIVFLMGGKPYYPGAIFTFLFAAAAVPLERWLAARRPLARGRIRPGPLMGVAMVASALLLLPIAVPLLPVTSLHSGQIQKINYDMGETIGWPRLVALVAREYRALPPGQRARTAILTSNYGEAGAIDRFGAADGLPQAYSGHNNFWLWGPPPVRDTSVLAVSPDLSVLRREFAVVRKVATYYNGLGIEDDEQGAPIYVATGLRSTWSRAWPAFRNYS